VLHDLDTKFTKEFTAKLKEKGVQHLDFLVSEFCEYYNKYRSHSERENLPPIREEPPEVETLTMEQLEVKSYVGGLVKSFERKRRDPHVGSGQNKAAGVVGPAVPLWNQLRSVFKIIDELRTM
jgi:hypothetical protein